MSGLRDVETMDEGSYCAFLMQMRGKSADEAAKMWRDALEYHCVYKEREQGSTFVAVRHNKRYRFANEVERRRELQSMPTKLETAEDQQSGKRRCMALVDAGPSSSLFAGVGRVPTCLARKKRLGVQQRTRRARGEILLRSHRRRPGP